MKRARLLLFLAVALTVSAALSAVAAAQSPNRAAVVVRLGDEQVERRCVAFEEPEISGYELLQRSGLNVEVSSNSMGVTVCRVEDTGCPPGNCFCQCRGDPCIYWSYWHLRDGNWQYSTAGSATYQVHDGAVDGWTWGPGTVSEAIAPPPVTFDEICSQGGLNDGTAALDVTAAVNADGAEPAGVNWLLYGAFGLIVLALLVALFWVSRRSARP